MTTFIPVLAIGTIQQIWKSDSLIISFEICPSIKIARKMHEIFFTDEPS